MNESRPVSAWVRVFAQPVFESEKNTKDWGLTETEAAAENRESRKLKVESGAYDGGRDHGD